MSKNIQVPQGWEVKKLGEVVEINKLTLKDNTDPNYKFTYIDLSSVNKGNIILSNEELFFKNAPSRARRIIEEDNIIIATVRPNLQGFAYIDFPCKDYIVSTGFAVLSYKNNIYMKFLYNMFYSNVLMGQINAIITGSNYPAINSNDIKNFSIPVPPLEEQKKIAEILSLWDKAIEQTKDLIVYKEKQKKGLMQALLTGKKRLNGFTDEWKTYQLGDITKMNSGGTPTTTKQEYYNGNINWVSITDITSSYKYLYKTKTKITELGLQNSTARLFPINTVLYAMYASIGECIIAKEEMAISQAILGVRCSDKLNHEYLFYLLYNYKDKSKKLAQQGTQANLNKEIVENFIFKIPTSLDEQKAIADILSSADEEIELLNKQLELYTEQKKGLMQNLLTGKVRV